MASSLVLQIKTPFPSASPSAFNTIGIFAVFKYSIASSGEWKFSYAAVGIPYFFMRSLEKALEPSKIAAFLRGPNTRRPLASNTSTMPPTSGSSIPTTVRSMPFSCAKSASLSNSMAEIGTHSAICPIPAFPGAQYNFVTFGLLFSFHAMACSLPPLPIISTFILPATFLHFLFTL